MSESDGHQLVFPEGFTPVPLITILEMKVKVWMAGKLLMFDDLEGTGTFRHWVPYPDQLKTYCGVPMSATLRVKDVTSEGLVTCRKCCRLLLKPAFRGAATWR